VRIDSELVNYREVFRVRYSFYATRDAPRRGRAGDEGSASRTIMPVTGTMTDNTSR
jgi:hypothetical protein